MLVPEEIRTPRRASDCHFELGSEVENTVLTVWTLPVCSSVWTQQTEYGWSDGTISSPELTLCADSYSVTLCADSYSVSVPPLCYRSGT